MSINLESITTKKFKESFYGLNNKKNKNLYAIYYQNIFKNKSIPTSTFMSYFKNNKNKSLRNPILLDKSTSTPAFHIMAPNNSHFYGSSTLQNQNYKTINNNR